MSLSFSALHRIFSAAVLILFTLFVFLLVYLYTAFNGPLTGDVRLKETPELLTSLQEQRLEAAVTHFDARTRMLDVPADMPNPFTAQK